MIVFPPEPKNGTRPALHVYGGLVPTEDGVKVACRACKRLLDIIQWTEDCQGETR